MKTIEEINQSNVKKILSEKKIPNFFPGDVVKVGVRITEGKKERIQYFEGVCIAKKSRDINSSFTVRKISFGEGVERTFPLYGTVIDSIKVMRSGKVRRAKLYYLRDRTGKSARIAEKIRKKIGIDIDVKPEILKFHVKHGKIATVTGVRPPVKFGELSIGKNDIVEEFVEKPQLEQGWINGGFFVLNNKIFNYLKGRNITFERTPLEKLCKHKQLKVFKHYDYWMCMDNLNEKNTLDKLFKKFKTIWNFKFKKK